MPAENNAEKSKNFLGDALSQETLEGMREIAKENLKRQLETKISDDLKALALAEKDPAFKNSAEIQQIKKELEATLEKIKALENPTEAEVTSLEAEREALSNKLSEASQAIEQKPTAEAKTVLPTETEFPTSTQPPKEKKSYMVQGKRDEELAGRIETESKEKQKEYQDEQLPLVAERLNDQKSKLREILTKPDLNPEKIEKIQEALRETDQFEMSAKVLKDRGELINNDVIERFWQRVENNFDIISEELWVPENLPVVSPQEIDRVSQELEQRLREEKEPAEKMDLDLGEEIAQPPAPTVELQQAGQETETEEERIKRLIDESFNFYQVVHNSGARPDEARTSSLAQLRDRLSAEKIFREKANDAVVELRKRIAEAVGAEEDAEREAPVNQEQFPPSGRGPSQEQKSEADDLFHKGPEPEGEPPPEPRGGAGELPPIPGQENITSPAAPAEAEPPPKEPELTKEPVESAEGEIPKEILEAAKEIAKVETIEDVKKIPEAVKKKISLGLGNAGFFVKERVNGKIAEWAGWLEAKFQNNNAARLVFSAIREEYYRDSAAARKKMEDIAEGKDKKTFSQYSYLITGAIKFGRIAGDILGYSAALPLRGAMMIGQMASRGAGFLEEARLKSNAVLEKTGRRMEDAEAAAEEFWKLYRQVEAEKGEGKVTAKDLEIEALPERLASIVERLKKDGEPGLVFKIQELVFKKYIEGSVNNLERKLKEIESDSSLTPQEKETKTRELAGKYSEKLKDFDRVLSDQGKADVLAMTAKYVSGAAKIFTMGMVAQTILYSAEKLWENLAGGLGEQAETIAPVPPEEKSYMDNVLGINSKDGLDTKEVAIINNYLSEALKNDDFAEFERTNNVYGQTEVNGTGKTLEDYLIARGEEAQKRVEELELTQAPEPSAETPPQSEPAAEPAPAAEQKTPEFSLGGAVDIKASHFENTIEPGGDSAWKSTKELFMQNRHQLGFDVNKDKDFGQWAEKQTAELMKDYAEAHDGKTPELVNPGDKVVVEMEGGKYHLKMVDAGGKEIEPQALPQKEITPEEQSPAAPKIETTPTTPDGSKSVTLEQYKDAFAKTPSENGRWGLVRQYLLNPELKDSTVALSPQELNAFVHLFEGRAEEWPGLEKNNLPYTLEQFKNNLEHWTQKLASGDLNKIFENGRPDQIAELKASIFPVETRNGEIFYVQMQNNGAWKMSQLSEIGQQIPLTRKKGLFGGETEFFDLHNVRKVLNSR